MDFLPTSDSAKNKRCIELTKLAKRVSESLENQEPHSSEEKIFLLKGFDIKINFCLLCAGIAH